MNWNWEPTTWRKSIKVLLGFVTIWPILYMILFMGSIFSMFLFLPFAERTSSRSCGNVDLLQLDRKIKNGEIKQLTVRPREIEAWDRIGDCKFEVTVTNESTKREILESAREIVNGRPRVEKIEEEAAKSNDVPIFVPIGFAAFIVVHMLSIFLMFLLMPLYIVLAVKNEQLDQTMRIIWVVLFCTVGVFANPVYWYLYIWRKRPPAVKSEGNAQFKGDESPATDASS